VSKKVLNDALIPIAKENWRQIGVLLKPQVVDFNALMAQQSRKLRSGLVQHQHPQRPARWGMGFLQQRS
jgi:ABC-type transport system substrate-binding protein